MDDVVLLAPTRHKLRRAVRVLNQTFDALGLEKHPDKTFIGRVERGFDFLGYHLAPGRLTLARATVERFVERAHRLPKKLLLVRLWFRPVRAPGRRRGVEGS
jgi:hypothetical protein